MAQRGIDNLKSNQPEIEPYIPPHKNIPEVTIVALILGALLSIVMGAANTYLGLYAGMTVSASIPAAVISMAILRGIFRRGTILENNIVQTMASTGESLAAGVIFTVPALLLIGEWQDFKFWPTTLIVMLGGLLGIVFMVPMRRALIVGRPDLVYPEGVACSEVLIVGEEGGGGIRWIALGLGIGVLFKFLVSGLHVIRTVVEGAVARGRSILYAGSDMSVALLAVGYIVNLQIAVLITLGGVIGWLIVMPLLGGYEPGMVPMEVAWELYATKVRYIGVGAMAVGGLYSIWHVRRGIVAGIAGLRGVKEGIARASAERPRTDRDMPLGWLLAVLLLTTFATFLFYDYLVGSVGVAAVTATIMILTAFLFVAVATYIAGLVGSSNSPVSGMTICALLIAAGTLLGLGIRGESAILATLGVAGVVCCAACTAGDVAQDLKTGQLVGATPARQQWTEMLGAIIPAFFFAPILSLLHNAYGIGTGEPGALRAPQAALFASLTDSFFGEGQLPWDMVGIGAAIGVGLIVLNRLLELSGSSFRTHVMPVAVGMYLPLSLDIPIFVGGLIRYLFGRRSARGSTSEAHDSGVLFGSGLIAGEAITGILLAPIILKYKFRQGEEGNWAVSLLIFGAIIALYASLTRRSRRAAS
jgi:putative OPT family oligopeptide transporter